MKAQLDQRILLILCTLLLLSTACAIPAQIQQLLNQQQQPTAPIPTEVTGTGDVTAVSAAETKAPSTPQPLPTVTNTLPWPTLRPSSTPYPTPTIARISVSQYMCDSSAFVKDITIPDGTTIPAGANFIKTWQLKNTGRCAWSTEYSIVHVKGESLGFNTDGLDASVESGSTTDVSVTLQAPSSPGSYRSYFQLKNKRGVVFGSKFYVDFKVVVQPTNSPDLNVKYEFATRYCDAAWVGNSTAITCPGTEGSSNGWMKVIMAAPVLETGYIDNEPGLLMNPPTTATTTDNIIYARYPAYTVQAGDHLATIIGCDRGATSCNVKFEIMYQIGSGATVSLGSWIEAYDNSINNIDISLSPLVGQSVNFILVVYSNGGSSGDRALWLRPRILNN
jgi:hypothetical protein